MRPLIASLVMATVGCGSGQIQNLQLRWEGVENHLSPSPTVAQALGTVPVVIAIRDMRPDTTAVGRYEDDGFVVRTTDNVAQYCSDHMAELMRNAGARLNENPMAVLATDIIDYHVDEGGSFSGVVRLRVTIHRNGIQDWAKDYEGTSKRWGRTHNPENFNEALSNSLAEAVGNVLHDEEFGRVLLGGTAPIQPPLGPPNAPVEIVPNTSPPGG